MRSEYHLDALFELVLAESGWQIKEIEVVLDKCFIDVDHVLMPFERAEPRDPPHRSIYVSCSFCSLVITHVVHLELVFFTV